MKLFLLSIFLLGLLSQVFSIYTGPFKANKWSFDKHLLSSTNNKFASRKIRFIVGLKQNLDEMRQEFFKVSDPYSSLYGKYLTQEELFEKFVPSKSNVDKVVHFLKSIKDSEVKFDGKSTLIEVIAPVENIEEAFGTTLGKFAKKNIYNHNFPLIIII